MTSFVVRLLCSTVLLVSLFSGDARAQVGTEPLAVAPEHRKLMDAIGTMVVGGQIVVDVVHVVRSEHRARSGWNLVCRDGAAYGIPTLLKFVIHEERPDGSDNLSFPSQHAWFAFAAKSGNGPVGRRVVVEVPVSLFVALSRPGANKHHLWPDVVAGAAGGMVTRYVCDRWLPE